jgi:hypothetical protein
MLNQKFLAVIGIITAIIWITFVSNTPEQCRFISEKEKKYLESVAERKDANKVKFWFDDFCLNQICLL